MALRRAKFLIGKSLIPTWLKGVSKKFRDEFPIAEPKPDYTLAKKYLEQAKKELGGTIPPLTLLSREDEVPELRASEAWKTVEDKVRAAWQAPVM